MKSPQTANKQTANKTFENSTRKSSTTSRNERVSAAAEDRSVNAVLIKVNQAGTVSEAKAALDEARRADFGTIVSARSGETEDVAIAHLSIGWAAGQLKVGSFSRSERMAKWNEVLRIEEELGDAARFAGLPWSPSGPKRVRDQR